MCEKEDITVVKVPDYIDIPYNCVPGKYKEDIVIDRCLVDEIKHLWQNGILTGGCCCGHFDGPGSIGVFQESVEKMKELGYKHDTRYNEMFFLPKTNKDNYL